MEKIQWLISEGALSGVLDDRGKFLYIEPKEYEAIAKFIELRGRVTMNELVEHGNKVIKARAWTHAQFDKVPIPLPPLIVLRWIMKL